MSRIALITADAELYERAGLLCRTLGLQEDVALYFARLSQAPELAQSLQHEEVEVIVVRGGLGILVKKAPIKIPIVEIDVTGQDLARIFLEAKAITGLERPRAAFVAFDNMAVDVEVIAQLANVDVVIHRLESDEDIPPVVGEVARLDYDVLLGGTRTVEIAKGLGMKSVLLRSGELSIKSALLEARKIAQGRQIEKENAEKFKTLIDCSFEGIISIDQERKIRLVNPAAAQLLELSPKDCQGSPLGELIDLPEIGECLQTGREIQGQVIRWKNLWISLNIGPIVVEHGTIGAFLTFQEISRIQEAEAMIRTEVLVRKFAAKYSLLDIVGQSPQIVEARRIAAAIASTDATLLIHGESGTGKELFAQGIHNLSPRKEGPFVAINCAALPPNLLESELFGYVEGAFTGALKKGKPGLFEMAHRGTLFLDEISEMDKYGQSRLLRALQEKQIMRLGGDKYIPVDVRVIAASNRNLVELVESGAFRQDIYYRLKVLVLNLPPLRRRTGDIARLAAEFLQRHQKTYKKTIELTREAYAELARHPWPGNVRELSHFIERLVVTARERSITGETIRNFIEDREYDQSPPAIPAPAPAPDSSQEARIVSALQETGCNMTKTAEALGISRPTLYRKLKHFDIKLTSTVVKSATPGAPARE
ncbi:MAG: sigma 54-interacting transcriptional regulator [Candidatus Accumulibacter sp.]|jgi:PAS domain S-box-containing protein|nr:sigma 54-interacting transcriptional regulator [Accumulibacter sp.]